MSFLIGALKVIFLLGFLIFIHEGAHFLAAKKCKISVREFSIGFGPKIISKQKEETNYSLRLIPLGGFVDLYEEDVKNKKNYANATKVERLAISSAGIIVNIIFGFIIYFILMTTITNLSTTIREIDINYAKEESLLQVGDRIKKVNGESVHYKEEIDQIITKTAEEKATLTIERDKEEQELTVPVKKITNRLIGIFLGSQKEEDLTSEIKVVQKGSPAEKAGILVGDRIIAVNNIETQDPYKIVELINEKEINIIKVERDSKILEFEVSSKEVNSYKLGIYLEEAEKTLGNQIYYAFWKTGDFAISLAESVKLLFTGNVSPKQMVGPIGISGLIVETNGIYDFLYLLSVISLSLGVTNLIPIPGLDGGKILLILVEAIRRKPLNPETEAKINMLGFSFLIMLSFYVTFNDVIRIL